MSNYKLILYKEKEGESRGHGDALLLGNLCPLVFRLDLSYRLYPSPFSNVSNEYVARYARS